MAVSGNKSLHRAACGFTLVEVTISLFLVTVAFAAFLGVALESLHDFSFFNSCTQVCQWNQQSVNEIRDDTLSVKQYFDNFALSSMSEDYFNLLDLPADSMPINGTAVLPRIEPTGSFEVDTAVATPKTGNALFFVRSLPPFQVRVQMDPTILDPADWHIYRVPVYTFVLYYLTLRVQQPIGRSPDSLDLIRWQSVAMLDYNHVMEFPEEVTVGVDICYPRAQVIQLFLNSYNGAEYLWVPDAEVDDAFYRSYADGTIDVDPMLKADMLIPMDLYDGVFSRMEGQGTNHILQASICMNRGDPGFEIGPIVPQLAIADATGDGFPHGFEVQIVGPSGARELLIRVAMAKQGSKGLVAKDFEAVLTTRDY
ncbi:MAG: hypothetical protein ABIK28_08930 [Planctomycetota bacterium]